ncbi:hypothetical protein [Aphanothece sacrum]|uniref:Glucosamine-6-phosphate deaminase n=1 Tax=Aphanothece sacrum FPU1 TaxID=1920663 RepID=A0A401IDR3_APHSA|nr:hypothetical protein [Aphanothece sacrum]GBF79339.1 glucosamine-6-phosphate deaminase [Aphanothece sacrum FPU1]GBF86841.1 glucosamine-6-phosphate deaminase [Aphanothece sacrum FPU3]
MGRKAKLKQRKKSQINLSKPELIDSDQFVQHLERQGYSLKKPNLAPEVPQKRIEPQI